MKILVTQGTTSKSIEVLIQNNSVTTGAGLGGLVFNSAGLTAYYYREGDNATTAITLVTATLGTWTSGGFIAVDGTNMLGVYQIGLPNAMLANLGNVVLYLQGATNMAPCRAEIQVVAFDPANAKNLGLSALPTATVGTNGGLLTAGTGPAQIQTDGNGNAYANCVLWVGTTIPAPALSGIPEVDVRYSAGSIVGNADGTLASATATTVTFPTTDALGNAIPDDTRYQYCVLQIVSGTGLGQVVNLTAKNGVRTFNILSGTCPVQLDSTSQYIVVGSWQSQVAYVNGISTSNVTTINANIGTTQPTNFTGTGGSALVQVDTRDFLGQAVQLDANNLPKMDVADWNAVAVGALPTNFSSLAITAGGAVTVGTNNDKSGYALTQAFPANFSSLSIDASGNVALTATQNPVIRTGTAQAGASTTITLDAGASATTNAYVGCVIYLVSGTGAADGQARTITAYNGTTKVATVDWPWETNPTSSTVFSIRAADNVALNSSLQPTSQVNAAQVASAVWQDATAGDFSVTGSIGKLLNTFQFDGSGFVKSDLQTAISNVVLAPNGLDNVLCETGITASANLVNDANTQLTSINARQVLALCGSILVGLDTGMGTNLPVFKAVGKPSVARVTGNSDNNYNRITGTTITVPT